MPLTTHLRQAPVRDTRTLLISEIFYSIQGESTWAGRPCVFVRLTGCNLRCNYCDTEYAFYDGARRTVTDVVAEVAKHDCELVEVTGGEPLLQSNVHELLKELADLQRTVLLETSGACDISGCDPRIIRVLDIKTPDSGESEANLWGNFAHLKARDEVKFVVCSRGDYEWARDILRRHNLAQRVHAVLMSPVQALPAGEAQPTVPGVPPKDLARWILADGLAVRLQLQLHKLIWDPSLRGV